MIRKTITAILLLTAAVLINPTASQAQKADANTKAAIAGKTYQGWSKGKFDGYPDANAASYMVFDNNSSGTCRQFFAYKPDLASADHHDLLVTYTTINGKAALQFTHKTGVDAGKVYITSYSNGAKVWVESVDPARPMKGWMLQVPAR